MKYEITYACGHTGEVDLYGKTRERESRIKWLGAVLCPECEMASFIKEAQEAGLPELTGTEKQIRYGIRCRHWLAASLKSTRELLERNLQRFGARSGELDADTQLSLLEQAYDRVIEITRASWWIDNKDSSPDDILIKTAREIYAEITAPEAEKEEKAQVEAEMILQPEKVKDPGAVCRITIRDNAVTVKSKYNPDIPALLKQYGYKWDPAKGIWEKPIGVMEGSSEDRAVEIGNKLLCAGFPVMIRTDLHERTVNGDYEPEYRRWIYRKGGNMETLYITWEHTANLDNAASRIPGCRRGRSDYTVPASSWQEILEFAEYNGFRLTPGASEAIGAYQAAVTVVKPVAGTDLEYESKEDGLKDILKSSRDVLEDLMDENNN